MANQPQPQTEQATFAGGCFWCTEAIFQRLNGVSKVEPGYTGGSVPNPTYEQVCTGTTGHTEAITITFNPDVITFNTLLDIFWHTHNPTTPNQQGADRGPQYRSAIFYHSESQQQQALASKNQLEQSRTYRDPIITQIEPFTNFYPAETYHQNYYNANPTAAYCSIVIDPKIKKLLQQYKKELKPEYQD